MHIEESLKEKADRYFGMAQPNMGDHLGIEFTHISENKITATMPVDARSIQPFGILHGGASVVLAETLCSVGGWFLLDDDSKTVVGVEINANHVRSVPNGGMVTGTARPVHTGRKIQVWETEITDENGKLVCTSRCTLAVVSMK